MVKINTPQKSKKIFCFPVLFQISLALMALDSPEGVMINNFGWNDKGRPVLGISYETEGAVEASGNGEIFFRGGISGSASRLPSPLGMWTAVDHGDGIISVYSRMEEVYSLPGPVEKNTPLGTVGTSGWSSTRGFYFFLFDRKEQRWINPSMITSLRPDTRPPAILSVRLKDAEGRFIDPAQTRTLGQGRYTVIVEATDTLLGTNEPPLAPYRILCSVNGAEAGALNFETYAARDGTLLVYRNGLIPIRDVFAPYPAWEAAEIRLTRGQATLEIIVQDFTGNSRNALFRLQVE
jgi:hypothetical protein